MAESREVEYNVGVSVPYEIEFSKDGALITTPYEADEIMTDSTKGLAYFTALDSDGAVALDTNDAPISSIPMFRHRTIASRAVLSLFFGYKRPGKYYCCIWYYVYADGMPYWNAVYFTTFVKPQQHQIAHPT